MTRLVKITQNQYYLYSLLLLYIFSSTESRSQHAEFISMGDTAGYPGDTVETFIYVDMSAPTIDLYFNGIVSSELNLLSYSFSHSALDTTFWNYYINFNENRFQATFVPDSLAGIIPENGIILGLIILIPTGSYSDTCWVYILDALVSDTLGMGFIDTALSNVFIYDLPWERGDVDHNGSIDLTDLQLLRNYIFENALLNGPIGVGDVNSDDFVDIVDYLLLKSMVY